MPAVRKGAVGLFVSDVHLWHKPPVARSKESDWYAAMLRPLKQIRRLKVVLSEAGGIEVPLVYAGDVFDRPNATPELISFAIRHLPWGYSVAGQHDLPYHNYADMKKSAYWTLCEAGVLSHLCDGEPKDAGMMTLHGFSWGQEVVPHAEVKPNLMVLDVAVIHAYVWCKGCRYPDAPESGYVGEWSKKLQGYDLSVFGDNHLGFLRNSQGRMILNNGTLMRRRSDEADYRPCVGVLYADGTVERIPLDTSEDVLDATSEPKVSANDKANFELLLHCLQSLKGNRGDYRASLLSYMDARGVPPGARRLILTALDEEGGG